MADHPVTPHPAGSRSLMMAGVVATIMVLLALIGVGLTTATSANAPTYWISLVPIFGILCVATAWSRARNRQEPIWSEVLRQVLHWLGIGVALALDFAIRGTGEESSKVAGMNALLLLALGCYLAGVHLDWMFIGVGLLLTVTLIVVAKADQYLWLIFILGGVVLVGIFGARRLYARFNKK